MTRSIAARHLWHQIGDYLESALRMGASCDEVIAVLRDRQAQIERHRASGAAPETWRGR